MGARQLIARFLRTIKYLLLLIFRRQAPHEELQYLDLIRSILKTGQLRQDRTETGTIATFAPDKLLSFTLSKPSSDWSSSQRTLILPLITTKKVFTRAIIEELLWFIRGSTDAKLLAAKDVHIWDGNGSREFLDKAGLEHREEGDLGPVYGFQWRHYGAEYNTCHDDYTGLGIDQLAEVIRLIKDDPTSRRIILDAWNPADQKAMALPPCHMVSQFYVTLPTAPSTKPFLSCLMTQRSADLGLDVPFNIASYAFLVHMIALMTDTIPLELKISLGDAHVYRDHEEALRTQLLRKPYEFPEFRFNRTKEEIGDIDGFRLEDFEVVGYKSHKGLQMRMSS
ncbi:hypothetical protein RQP46_006792 [Phenoliferia psychrophenolica]